MLKAYPFGICQWVAKKTYSVYTNPFFMEQFLADLIAWEWVKNSGFADNWM